MDLPEMGVLAYDNLVVNELDIVGAEGVERGAVGRTVTRSDDREVASRPCRSHDRRTAAGGRPRLAGRGAVAFSASVGLSGSQR